jgi:hypothetical protein
VLHSALIFFFALGIATAGTVQPAAPYTIHLVRTTDVTPFLVGQNA